MSIWEDARDSMTDAWSGTTDSEETIEEARDNVAEGDTLSFSDFAPDWLTDNAGFLETFAKNPRETILGVIVGAIVGGVIDLWEIVLGAMTLVAWGDSITTTAGQIGILDIPLVATELLVDAAGPVGTALLAPITGVYGSTAEFVGELGIAAWPVAVAIVVATVVLVDRTLRRTGRASLAAIPIVGPFLEALLR